MSSDKTTNPEQVADLVHSAAIHLLRRLRKTDVDIGISPARLSVLSVLVFAGAKTPGELAQIEQVRPPTVTKLIQALETDGLVMRKTHARDKRALMIMVTAKGRRKLINAQQLRIRKLTELINTLNPDEQMTLAESSRIIERLAKEPDPNRSSSKDGMPV